MAEAEKSCHNCAHYRVCEARRDIERATWDRDTYWPTGYVKVDLVGNLYTTLAKNCQQYGADPDAPNGS